MTTSIPQEQTKPAPAPATTKVALPNAAPPLRRPRASRAGRRAKKAAPARRGSKTAKILDLLKRPGGVTLKELIKATGWQAHSVRGFLSGTLGKKLGTPVESSKRADGERAYRSAQITASQRRRALCPAALSLSFALRNLHQHDQVMKPVFGPTTEPTHLPIAEPGTQCHFGAKAKEFRFHLHVIPSHSFRPHIHPSSSAEWQARCIGRDGGSGGHYLTIFAVAFLPRRFHSNTGGAGGRSSTS